MRLVCELQPENWFLLKVGHFNFADLPISTIQSWQFKIGSLGKKQLIFYNFNQLKLYFLTVGKDVYLAWLGPNYMSSSKLMSFHIISPGKTKSETRTAPFATDLCSEGKAWLLFQIYT